MSNFWGAYQYDVLIAVALLVCWLSLVLHKYTYLCRPINEDVIEQ